MSTYRFAPASRHIRGWLFVMLVILLLGACGTSPTQPTPSPESIVATDVPDAAKPTDAGEATSSAALTGVVDDANELALGDLDDDQMQLRIQPGALPSGTTIAVAPLESAPEADPARFAPLGEPLEITAGQTHVRLDAPAVLVVPLPSDAEIDPSLLGVAFYNGQEWQVLRPARVDPEVGVMEFETFHFSWFWPAKQTPEERDRIMIQSAAAGEIARQQVRAATDRVTEQMVNQMMDQLGAKDGETRALLIEAVKADASYKQLQQRFANGDLQAFMPVLEKTVATALGGTLQEQLGKLLDPDDGTINPALKTLDKGAEAIDQYRMGNYKDAGKAVAALVIDLLPKPSIVAVFEAEAVVVDYCIDAWKKDEVEAAYKAWRDGADSLSPWGYNVDAQDFEAVWTQMRGAATRFQSEAVERFVKAAEEAGLTPTDAQIDAIREQTKTRLEEEFKRRLANEQAQAAMEAELTELLQAYEDANLLEWSRYGYDRTAQTREQRMRALLDLRARILNDTGRERMTLGAFSNDKAISIGDIVSLTQLLLSKDGKEKYAQALKDRFGITLGPPELPEDFTMTGAWVGDLIVQDAQVTGADELTIELFDSETVITKEECESSLEEAKGRPTPVEMIFAESSPESGTFVLRAGDDEDPSEPIPYRRAGTQVTASYSQDGATFTLQGTLVYDGETVTFDGTWNMSMPGEMSISVDGTFSVVRS